MALHFPGSKGHGGGGGGRDKGPAQQLSAPAFARMVSEGVISARDRFGVALAKGQAVEYRPELAGVGALIFEVIEVQPVMDPRMPGMVQITLAAVTKLTMPANVAQAALRVHGVARAIDAAQQTHATTEGASTVTVEGVEAPLPPASEERPRDGDQGDTTTCDPPGE
jgi:hypothetical protein